MTIGSKLKDGIRKTIFDWSSVEFSSYRHQRRIKLWFVKLFFEWERFLIEFSQLFVRTVIDSKSDR
jgi:hypothetical protein